MQSRFARMQAEEWDKLPREADKALDQEAEKLESIRRASGIARIRATASHAKSETRSERRHRLALEKAAAARYNTQMEAAEVEYMAAEAEYNDSMIEHDSRYWKQAAAFATVVLAEQRLVHRAKCKRVLTAVVTIAKQRQQ